MTEWNFDMEAAPKDGTKFWGLVGEDALAMFWHEGFGEFVTSFRVRSCRDGRGIYFRSSKRKPAASVRRRADEAQNE